MLVGRVSFMSTLWATVNLEFRELSMPIASMVAGLESCSKLIDCGLKLESLVFQFNL